MKGKNIKILIKSAIPGIVLILPLTAFADVTSLSDVQKVLERVAGFLYTIFFIVAAIFIIVGAFTFLTAQGDEEKVTKAKKMIMYAVVAIVVALLATSVKVIVSALF